MRVADFDFDLPDNLIALSPARPRDAARLLHVTGAALADRHVRDLPDLLQAGDVLVLNDTRVVPAQLRGRRPARTGEGGAVEIDLTLHKRLASNGEGALWRAFARPAKRLAVGDRLAFGDRLAAVVEARDGAEALLRFDRDGDDFALALDITGAPPLPPYIARKRAARAEDAADYQTVFADRPGSVAAPTAGLHFTEALFAALDARGVLRTHVTLHVGAGTFLPVSVEDTEDHVMHAEWGEVSPEAADLINAARRNGGRVVAVGTTALRLLETAAAADGALAPFTGETSIFITPGYRFRAVDLLMTNFHLPRSTLFMLVAAFCGRERTMGAYAHAIAAGYRFYSFGDACLFERAE